MRRALLAGIPAVGGFVRGWRSAAMAGYRRQHGLFAALPILWGCLDAFVMPIFSTPAFLAMAWFLEGRVGKRLACQALFFACWSGYLGEAAGGRQLPVTAANVFSESKVFFEMEGVVESFPSRKRKLTFAFTTREGTFRVLAEEPAFSVRPGQRLKGRFRPAPPPPPGNPGQFDYPAFLRSQNLGGILEAEDLSIIGSPGPFHRLIIFLREWLEAGLTRSVPEAQAPLLRAALLGVTDDLDPALVEDFKSSGMLHILAISGQHVGILALILLQVFSLLRLPRKAAFLATGAVLALYVPICGSQISVVRAAIMFWACLPSILFERPGSAMNNLGWAAAAILAWMPHQILSLGFQLSFAATFFLILYSRPIAVLLARFRIRGVVPIYFVSTPALSVVIYFGVYPILAAAVHAVAPSSILGNLATVGISSGMLVSACLALLFQPIELMASCFGESAGALAALLAESVHVLARWPGAALSVSALAPFWSLLLLFLVLALPFALRTGRGPILILMGAAVFSGRLVCNQAWESWRKPASVVFLNVGQGDGVLCRLPGATLLIDAGPPEAGRNVLLPYLRHQGINRLDLVVITHPDLDHYGGLAYVIGHIEVGKVVHPGEGADTQAWKTLVDLLAQKNIPMEVAVRGQGLYQSESASLSVLSPDHPGQYAERNDNSVVAILEVRRRKFLFTGDMGPNPELRLMSRNDGRLRGAVLKVPHHGSDLSNAIPFLEEVRPPIAVFSAGRLNRFGHPGPVTVEALGKLDSRMFLTARDGAVTWSGIGSAEAWTTHLRDTTATERLAGLRRPSRRNSPSSYQARH
ncbi:MAG: DNA internalization-related competence protein ComEC/Rec2 [Fibrobacterota bacterium]|nr:DNA internalization-related competence protein ComEC/Rec2 [Fibrobacterota bacterium]